MEKTSKNNENSQSDIDSSNNCLHVWYIIENIVTILVTAELFWLTNSPWCFIFLLNMNMIKN